MKEQTSTPAIDQRTTTPRVRSLPSQPAAPDRLWIVLSFLALYLIWGSTYFAISIAIKSIPPLLMAGVRFLMAGIVLYCLLRLRGTSSPTRKQWVGSAIVGLFLGVGGMGGVAFAEQWVASSVTAFCIATTPLWISLFAGLWGRWPARTEWLGLLIGFIGVICLNIGSGLWASPLGAIILLLSPMCWAFGSAWSRHLALPGGLMASAAQMLTGGVFLTLLGLAIGERPPGQITLSSILALAYLFIFGSLVAFTAYGYLLQRVRPALATSYAYINPLVAACLGILFASDHITPLGIIGMLVILTGVALVSLAHERKTTSASPTNVQAQSAQ